MEDGGVGIFLVFINIILKIVGVIVCSDKASKTNRNSTTWGIFGFFMPIIAMIIASTLKPKTDWHNEDENEDE
jgi:hypothetical protein